MPAVLALPAFWGAVAGVAGGTGAIVAGHEASSGATDAAAINAKATSDAAALTAKGNADTLAYEKTQAAQTQANFDTTQKANYDQWAAREGRLSSLGTMVGLAPRNIPGYVAPSDVSGDGSLGALAAAPPSGATPAGAASSNPTDPNAITAQLQANYKALGVTATGPGTGPTDLAYYGKQIAATGGLTPQNVSFWFGPSGRIAADLAKASGGAGGAATTTPNAPLYSMGTLGSALQPVAPAVTGNLTMPTAGSLGSYAGVR